MAIRGQQGSQPVQRFLKRMFEALGCRVVFLKRLSMGSLKLDPELKPGEYRPLTEEELELLGK